MNDQLNNENTQPEKDTSLNPEEIQENTASLESSGDTAGSFIPEADNVSGSGNGENQEQYSGIISDTPESVPPAPTVYYNKPVQKKSMISVFVIIMLSLIFILAAALGVYCVVSDINGAEDKIQVSSSGKGNTNVILNSESKPAEAEDEYIDENGKYTTEGIAKYIRPQIVEIFVYDKSDTENPVGSGSGIIITQDGYIVTNTHVIDSAEVYMVTTSDDEVYQATVVGRDAKTDIAVIKIDAEGLSAAVLGDSDEVQLGEKVVAIGNPAGLTGSVSDGIISGIDRKIKTDSTGYEMSCLQTDAAISAGNSGGALVNMYGQVIGITSSKYIDYINLSYEGLGFAITINEAKPIIEELISTGYVSGRVRIGISFFASSTYIDSYFESVFGFEMPDELKDSLMVTEISDECDISNTKLEVNDFILSVNGNKVTDYDELNQVLKQCKAGDTLKAKCARVDSDGNVTYFDIEFKLMEDTSGDF